MLVSVFGVAGSGKSYYVTKNYIIDKLDDDYHVLSNIELNPLVDAGGDYTFLTSASMHLLNSQISSIFQSGGDIEEISEKLHTLFLLKTKFTKKKIVFIVDECHLFGWSGRSTSNPWADQLASIHRHIMDGFDIVLITQVPSRLNREIQEQAEIAVKAIPSSQRLFTSRLEYKLFASVSAMKTNDKTMLLKSVSYSGDTKVFDYYVSGFSIKGSDALRKKMMYIVLGLVAIIAYIVYSFMSLTDHSRYSSTTKNISNITDSNITDSNITDSNITDSNITDSNITDNDFYDNTISCIPFTPHFPSGFLYKTSKEICYLIKS